MAETKKLFYWWEYSRSAFEGKVVVDLGAGSKLRSKYFEGARLIAIEPLADRYLQGIKWCDLKDAEETYSVPAEELVPQVKGRADFVMCINVLDHVYNPDRALANARAYLKKGGEVCALR